MLTRAERESQALAPEETADLARRYRCTGDTRLVDRIVEGNLRLAWRYLRRFRHVDAPHDDLRQQAYLALFEAARRYDPEANTTFSTYAWYWLNAMVLGYVVQDHGELTTGRSPPVSKVFFNLGRVSGKLEAAGIEATDENVARMLNVDPGIVSDMRRARRTISMDVSDKLYDEGDPRTVAETIPGEAQDPIAALELREFREQLDWLLSILTERERAVINYRFRSGFTFSQTGRLLGLTHQGAKVVEARALAKMRAAMTRCERRCTYPKAAAA
jgi:RNA polymerase sigma-32 factor